MVREMNGEMQKKIHLVFVSIFGIPQNYIDSLVLDSLRAHFDVEWWACSDILYPKYTEADADSPYVLKIRSLDELKRNLRRIPKDTLLIRIVPWVWKNRRVDKLMAKQFPKIVLINSYSNTPSPYEKEKEELSGKARKNLLSVIKKPLYQSYSLKTAIKILFHPQRRHTLLQLWQFAKEWNRFKEIVVINCAKGSEYYINHPDVERYVRLQSSTERRSDRFIVYIDQNFPYHLDLKIWQPDINIEDLEHSFFPSINRFFDHLERVYDCKVVIAVHPKAQNLHNPFNGREMVCHNTAALVRDSIGVCMHSSNALSFVVLYDKPVVSMVNNAIKKVERPYNQLVNMVNQWDVPCIDTDSPSYEEYPLAHLSPETRRQYIEYYFGDIESSSLQSNADLMKKHFHGIYHRFYA